MGKKRKENVQEGKLRIIVLRVSEEVFFKLKEKALQGRQNTTEYIVNCALNN